MAAGTIASILGIVLCLAASAVFSASETALSTFGRVRTRRLLDEGGADAQIMRLWDQKPDEILITILIGNNAVNITASALATELAHRLLAPYAELAFVSPIAIAIGAMTFLLLTFGEILPKTYARAHCSKLAMPAMRVLTPVYHALRPVNAIFMSMARRIGARPTTDRPLVEEGDLTYLVGLGEAEGAISDEQARLLQSVFDLDDRTAREVMVPLSRAVAVAEGTSLPKLLETVVAAGHSRIPVYSGERTNIVGVCYAKDVLRFVTESEVDARFDLRELCRPPRYIPAERTIDQVLRDMQERHVHLAFVIDEGTVAGIVTLEDIIEELIGEVYDEHDRVAVAPLFAPAIRRRLQH